jgi:hypothetical protein
MATASEGMAPFGEWTVHAAKVVLTLLSRFKAAVQRTVNYCYEEPFTSIATDTLARFVIMQQSESPKVSFHDPS